MTQRKKGVRREGNKRLTSCNNPLILISMSSIILPVFVMCEVGSCTEKSCSDLKCRIRRTIAGTNHRGVHRQVDGKVIGGQFVGRRVAGKSIDGEKHIGTSGPKRYRVSMRRRNERRGVTDRGRKVTSKYLRSDRRRGSKSHQLRRPCGKPHWARVKSGILDSEMSPD